MSGRFCSEIIYRLGLLGKSAAAQVRYFDNCSSAWIRSVSSWGTTLHRRRSKLSRERQNERLQCRLGDIRKEPDAGFDLLLILDVLEHQENYFSFLRGIKSLSPYKLFHTVLDLSAQAVLRKGNLSKRRQITDDLHFFTKETFLQSLRDEQYEILDWFYVPRSAHRASGISRKILQLPRKICFALDSDLAARLLGGYSLFVLAK